MSTRSTVGDVTVDMLRKCGRIYVSDDRRFALLSRDRLLPRFRESRAEGGMSPPELQVIVGDLTREVFQGVTARLHKHLTPIGPTKTSRWHKYQTARATIGLEIGRRCSAALKCKCGGSHGCYGRGAHKVKLARTAREDTFA